MARNYANVYTGIWRDEDFRGLTGSAQRTYFLLKSQPDITAAGVLSLTVGRWASMAADTTADGIRADLDELALHSFIAMDFGSEELLVRTFVKWDGGHSNRKRRPVIIAAAKELLSPQLRRVLAVEFARLGLPTDGLVVDSTPPDRPSGRPSVNGAMPYPDATNASHIVDKPSWDQPTRFIGSVQVNTLSDEVCDGVSDGVSPSDRVVVSKGEYLDPATLNPQPPTRGDAHAAPDPTEGEGNRETNLIETIREMRPEWSARSISRALRDDEVASRPWAVVAVAMGLVAKDPQSQSPGRIKADGPWWAAAASASRVVETAVLDAALVHDYEPGEFGCAHCQLPEHNRRHQVGNVIPFAKARAS